MGESHVLAVGQVALAVLASLSLLPAQGPVYRERWSYLHLEHRRDELRQELLQHPAALARATAALAADDQGVPFRPLAQALAAVRDVPCDEAFLLRCSVGAFVLPEVCDPDSTKEDCRVTNVSVFLPYPLPLPAKLAFTVVVYDSAGKERWRSAIQGEHDLTDLRMGRATAKVPSGELGDGSYVAEVLTSIDGKEPGTAAPRLRWPFHVLRGYQRRSEAAMPAAHAQGPKLSPAAQAVLTGSAGLVGRAYTGEAFAVHSDAVHDLERLEQQLAALERGESLPAQPGIDLPLAIPVPGGNPLAAVLRIAAAEAPLLVVIAGAPGYDLTGRRPTAPVSRDPAWLANEFAGFGKAHGWNLAFVESPGGGRDFAQALVAALPVLRQLAPVRGKPLLVCEREAAAVLGLSAHQLREAVGGFLLVGGGAMPANLLQRVGPLPIRYARVHGSPANDGMQRVVEFAAGQATGAAERADVRWLDEQELPWPFALSLRLPALEAGAAACLPR